MRDRIAELAQVQVLDPIADELALCARFRDELSIARGF